MSPIGEKSVGAPVRPQASRARRKRGSLVAPYPDVEAGTLDETAERWSRGRRLGFIVVCASAAWALILGAVVLFR